MKEIEAKLKLNDSFIITQANLIQTKEVHVLDIYYDGNHLDFKSQDKILRLRKENDKIYLAYKGPKEKNSHLIVRKEIEPEISSFKDARIIIKNLNLYEVAKTEKIRTYFKNKRYPNLTITINKYPFIGKYIEVKGEEDEVYVFLKEFNFNLNKTIQKNYTELFLQYCKTHNLLFKDPQTKFTFKDEEDFIKNKKVN